MKRNPEVGTGTSVVPNSMSEQLWVSDEWAVYGMLTHMSNEAQISAFIKTIPKD